MAYCHVLNSGIDWTCWCFTFCILGFNLCCYICPQHSIFFASYILSSLLCASPWGFHHILCSLFHFTFFFQFALHCTPLSLVCSFSILHQSLFLLWPPTFCCYCCLIPHCFFVCALHFSFVSGTLLSSFFHFALCVLHVCCNLLFVLHCSPSLVYIKQNTRNHWNIKVSFCTLLCQAEFRNW